MKEAQYDIQTLEEEMRDAAKLAIKADKGYFSRWSLKRAQNVYDYDDETTTRSRRISRRRGALTLIDKINIVYKIVIEHEMMKDVAKEYRVSQ